MIRNTTKLALCASTGLFYLATASHVWAADATAAAPAQLEEIVVTANKRSENLQKVPESVSVVSQKALQSVNVTDTSALTRLVPSMSFNQSFIAAANEFSVRGVGSLAGGVGVEQAVGVAFDGVPLGSAAGTVADLVDVQQVEVLKGPQGMLFGKNASAGLINILANTPKLGVAEAIGRVSYGSRNDQQFTGTVNLPLGENIAARLSAWKFSHDGVVTEANTGQKMNDKNATGARLKLRWDPTAALTINLTAEFTAHRQNGEAYTIRQYEPADYSVQNAGAAGATYDTTVSGQKVGPNNTTAYDIAQVPYYDKGHTEAYTGQADYSLGGGTLTTIVSYRQNDIDQSSAPYPSSYPSFNQPFNIDVGKYKQTSAEVHYASPKDQRFRYVAGLFYFKEDLLDVFRLGVISAPLPSVDNTAHQTNNKTNYAVFAQGNFDITPQLQLIGGLRESLDEVRGAIVRVQNNNPTVFPFFPWNGPGDAFGTLNVHTGKDSSFTSWKAGLQYQAAPDLMTYVTATEGYKAPGVMYNVGTATSDIAANGNNGIVKTESVRSYEAGFKSMWFERRVTLNLSIYDETFTNFQTALRASNSTFSVIAGNAPEMKTDGVEMDGTWAVTPKFSLSAAVAYTDARFTDFPDAPCYGVGETAAQGCVTKTVGGVTSTYQDMKGKPLFGSPKWSANLNAHYEQPLTGDLVGVVNANYAYKSKQYFEAKADPNEYQAGYGLASLSGGVHADDNRWGVTVSVDNLFDTHYVESELSQGSFIGQIIGYNYSRTFHVALDTRF